MNILFPSQASLVGECHCEVRGTRGVQIFSKADFEAVPTPPVPAALREKHPDVISLGYAGLPPGAREAKSRPVDFLLTLPLRLSILPVCEGFVTKFLPRSDTMGRIIRLSFMVLLVGLFLMSCATTRVTDVWKDGNYTGGPVKKVFVVGVLANPDMRVLLEEEFVEQFQGRGTQAVASRKYMSVEPGKVSRQDVAAKVREAGADSVLVVRIVGRSAVDRAAPADTVSNPWTDPYNFSSFGVDMYSGPGFGYEQDFLFMESRLFELKGEKPVWSARSKIWWSGTRSDIARDYVKAMMGEMSSAGLVR